MPRTALLVALVLAPTLATAEPIEAARAAELERLVRHDCGSCHGMTLKGGLGPDLRAATLAGRDPASLAAVILEGVPTRAMPGWAPLLTVAEADWIVRYLLQGTAP